MLNNKTRNPCKEPSTESHLDAQMKTIENSLEISSSLTAVEDRRGDGLFKGQAHLNGQVLPTAEGWR